MRQICGHIGPKKQKGVPNRAKNLGFQKQKVKEQPESQIGEKMLLLERPFFNVLLGQPYYTLWDGYTWKFGEGAGDTLLLEHKNIRQRVVQFCRFIANNPTPSIGTQHRLLRLEDEAAFITKHSLGDLSIELDAACVEGKPSG